MGAYIRNSQSIQSCPLWTFNGTLQYIHNLWQGVRDWLEHEVKVGQIRSCLKPLIVKFSDLQQNNFVNYTVSEGLKCAKTAKIISLSLSLKLQNNGCSFFKIMYFLNEHNDDTRETPTNKLGLWDFACWSNSNQHHQQFNYIFAHWRFQTAATLQELRSKVSGRAIMSIYVHMGMFVQVHVCLHCAATLHTHWCIPYSRLRNESSGGASREWISPYCSETERICAKWKVTAENWHGSTKPIQQELSSVVRRRRE